MNTRFSCMAFLIALFASSSLSWGLAPLADTIGASNVTLNAATLHGLVTPRTAQTKTWFEWGLTTNYGQLTVTQTLSSGSTPVPVQQSLSGLSGLTTYHFRVVAKNGDGTRRGTNVSFTTPNTGAPIIDGSNLNIVASGPTSANGNAWVRPNNSQTAVYFQWGLTTNYGNSTVGSVINGDSFATVFVVMPTITGLQPDTVYHARVYATNGFGAAWSTNETFMTLPAGTADTLQPTNITLTTATLRGRVYPSGVSPATAYFQYVRTGGGHPVLFTPTETLINASNRTLVTATISNLDASVQYAYNLVVNTGPVGYGPTVTFVTGANPPIVQTTSASGIAPTAATLNALVNPNGLATGMAFEWGLTTNYGNFTPVQTAPTTFNNLPIAASVSHLLPNTNYHFRVLATNGMGSSLGNDQTFATFPEDSFAVFTLFPSNITTNSATLHGSVNPNGSPTTAYFQWGTTTNYGAATPPQSIGSGSSFVPVEANLSPLLTDMNYHYRFVASNALGIVYGSNVMVTPTALLYLYAGESWSYVFHDLPFYNWYSLPDRPQTRASFAFVPGSFAPGSAVLFQMFANSPNEAPSFSTIVTNSAGGFVPLFPNTMWLDRQGAVRLTMLTGSVVVSSMLFQQIGNVSTGSFYPEYRNGITTTKFPQPPLFGTQSVSSVNTQSVVFRADINAKNLPTDVFVQWGTTTNYGSVTVLPSLDFDYFVQRTFTLSNVVPDTTYHVRFVATNGAGLTYGNDLGFSFPTIGRVTVPSAQGSFTASNPDNGDAFGQSVSVSGNTMVVGALREDSNATGVNGSQTNGIGGTNSGAAYVLVRLGTNWVQQAYVKASNTDANDLFGYAVAISANTVVVGAPNEASNATGINGDQSNNGAPGSGAAYVFVRNGSNWTQQAYLKASNAEAGDSFGCAVAVNGDTILIGASGEGSSAIGVNGDQNDNSKPASGAAYVFMRNGTNWTQQAYLKASNPDANDLFGLSLSIAGDTVVVGAYGEASSATGVNSNQIDNSAPLSGAAYVFVRTESNWSQQAYLKASNAQGSDLFGISVAISAETVVVGADHEDSHAIGVNGNQNDNTAPQAGAAYVFVRSGTNWNQQAYLKASTVHDYRPCCDGDRFGYSVAVSGNAIVVGAIYEDSGSTGVNGDQSWANYSAEAGAAYVFIRDGTNWSQQAYLKSNFYCSGVQACTWNYLGTCVALDADTAVVGGVAQAGTVYVFAGLNRGPRTTIVRDRAVGYIVGCDGLSGFTYQWERATNVNGPWLPVFWMTPLASGAIEFHDTNAPTSQSFYRVIQQ